DDPPGEPGQQHETSYRDRLQQHSAHDQSLAAEVVADPASTQLSRAPDGRIGAGQDADLAEAEPVSGKEEWQQRPGHAVVEVVDHARLAGARHCSVAKADVEHKLADGSRGLG